MQSEPERNPRNRQAIFSLLIISLILLGLALPWIMQRVHNNEHYGISVNIPVPDIPGNKTPENGFNIVFFGYLNCGTVCPEQILTLSYLHRLMKNDPVHFIFITLAPDMDNDKELARVMSSLGENFSYFRPESILSAQQLALSYTDIAARYRIDDRTEINHKGALFVVSPEKTIIRIYAPEHSDPDKIKADLIQLISQRNNTDT